ncbi:transglycosylase SLT domain-containing protein [uncultured Jannaschia sp.]|uniref:transglycosylase SLT domain-containing protein n=1 Tax=uncultured Jannaschia sp. TaxID=293347 RepID=UPI0026141BFA|nr:transglycosylase SLT domain-containing protein [uncultured Jannaschia sp.]
MERATAMGQARRVLTGLLAAFVCSAGIATAETRPVARLLETTGSSMSLAVTPTPPDLSLLAPDASLRPILRPRVEEMPDLRWDHVRGSSRWTRAAMRALDSHGDRLIDTVPRDIEQWCPAYPEADRWTRKAFWAGLLSTLSKHESTYRPTAVGGGGLWYGLVQILPATARGYGCQARSGEALKDGALNMSCAVRILNVTVPRDGVVSRGYRGVAADWGPFHSNKKREDMRRWLTRQPFCNGLHRSARPVLRPDWLLEPAGEPEEIPTFVAWELDKAFFSRVRLEVSAESEIAQVAAVDG